MAAIVTESAPRPAHMATQLKFRMSQRSCDEPNSITPHDDPLRILVPAQKKLSTIESQRVLAVVDSTARRLESALAIPSLADNLERLSIPLGSELVQLLQEYRDTMAEFEAVSITLKSLGLSPMPVAKVKSRSSCSSLASGSSAGHGRVSVSQSRVQSVEEQFCNLQQRIRHNVKSTLRAVATNKSVLQGVHHEKMVVHTQLMETMRGLQSISNEILLTTRMEELKRKEHLDLVAKRRLTAEESIRRLEEEVAAAQKQKDEEVLTRIFEVLLLYAWLILYKFTRQCCLQPREVWFIDLIMYDSMVQVSVKKAQINQLCTTIKMVAELAQDKTRKMRAEAEKLQSQAEITHTNVKSKLEEEIGTLKKQLQDSVAENREKEQETRKV